MTRTIIIAAGLLLAACGEKPERPAMTDEAFRQIAGQVATATVEVEYTKRLSDSETIRGLRIPYSGNIFLSGVDDVRCLLYVNDTYRTTQIVCPDSAERHPRDEVREVGTSDPIN